MPPLIKSLLGIAWEAVANLCDIFAKTLIRSQRMHFHVFLGLVDPPSCWMSPARVRKNFRDGSSFLGETWRARALIAANFD